MRAQAEIERQMARTAVFRDPDPTATDGTDSTDGTRSPDADGRRSAGVADEDTRGGATPYILLAPFLGVTFAVFLAYPLVRSVLLSTERTFGPGASGPVGLENFRMLLRDPVFWKAARNTLIFTAGSVLRAAPARAAAGARAQPPESAGAGGLPARLLLPQLVGLVFSGMLASLMFEKKTGLINRCCTARSGSTSTTPGSRSTCCRCSSSPRCGCTPGST
jgi:hypothetical protein